MTALGVAARPVRQEADEGRLVARVRDGDDRAFEVLYERYQARISAYVLRMVRDHGRAEDITQEVFISALRRMRATEQPISVKPWLYEIAKNACIDAFRRRRGEEVSFDAWDGWPIADQRRLVRTDGAPDDAMDAKQRLDDLRGAFGGVSDQHRDILVLRELEGLSYQAIGERLGLSQAAVESTLFRARRKLGEEYEELASGQRCEQVQRIIATAGARAPGLRDERRMARHISHCQPCRRYAVLAGVDVAVRGHNPMAVKIAAFLPLPAFLKRRWSLTQPDVLTAHGSPQLAQWSASMAQTLDPSVAGWGKAVATAATVAIAGIGAGAATNRPIPIAGSVTPGSIVKKLSGGEDQGATPVAPRRTPSSSPAHGGATGIIYDSGVAPDTSPRVADDTPAVSVSTRGITGVGNTGHSTPTSSATAPASTKADNPPASPSAPAAPAPSSSTTAGRTDTPATAPATTGITSTPASTSAPSTTATSTTPTAPANPLAALAGRGDRRQSGDSQSLPTLKSSSPPAAAPDTKSSGTSTLKLTFTSDPSGGTGDNAPRSDGSTSDAGPSGP